MTLIANLTAAFLTIAAFTGSAFAAPQTSTPTPSTSAPSTSAPSTSAPSTAKTLKGLKLPSQAQIDTMLEKMPDFNAIMGDVLELAKDEKMQERLETTAESFKDILDEDLLTKRDANGLPDINALMAAMLGVISEDGPAGELLEDVAEIAGEMEAIAKKHTPEAKP